MRFAYDMSVANIKRHPGRSAAMAGIVALLGFTIFAGAYMILCLRGGLSGYRDRLGADIIVTPASARGDRIVDDILLTGITGNYYMSEKDIARVEAVEGVESVSRQFFLTSAKASCCSARVQIIGFDPDNDISIMPWIEESYSGTLQDGDVLLGANISMPEDRTVTFYGNKYRVAARLAKTGTGMDSAVYTNMNTIRQMAESAARLLETSPFRGVNIKTAASSLLINVKDGYNAEDVADDINIHITKADAVPAGNMVTSIANGLGRVSTVIGVMVGALWFLALIVLVIAFLMLTNERRKEFGVLRTMGASRRIISRVNGMEAGILSLLGAGAGTGLAMLLVLPLTGTFRKLLELPFLSPGTGAVLLLFLLSVGLAVLAGMLTAKGTASGITRSEAGLLLRENT